MGLERLAVDSAPMLPNVGRRWGGCSKLQLLLGANALLQPGVGGHRTICLVGGGWVGVVGLAGTNLSGLGQWVGGRVLHQMASDSRWAGSEDLPRERWGLGLVGRAVHGCGHGCRPNRVRGGGDR